MRRIYAPRRPSPASQSKPQTSAPERKFAALVPLLALYMAPVWCFDQRCYVGEPVGIEQVYLRPSLMWCYSPEPGHCAIYLLGKMRHAR